MANQILRQIDAPAVQARLPVNKYASWHTWSSSFLAFLRDASDRLRELPSPPLIRIAGMARYNRTFSLTQGEWGTSSLHQRLAFFARSLFLTRPTRKLILLDRLLDADFDGSTLHALLALMRAIIVEQECDELAAMYTPLGEVGKRAGAFPLHADLYIPRFLLNVFDDVSDDDTGASIFLPISMLRQIMAHTKSMPAPIADRLLMMFKQETGKDRFNSCYSLLHGTHAWVPDLEQELEKRQLRIRFRSGQGYLLCDRTWLHGREAPLGGVAVNRVHRFVFGHDRS